MSEHIVHSYEVEEVGPDYKIIGFADGGVSAIVVGCPGDTVRLFEDDHKYVRSPERSSDGRVYIKGHTAGGETVFLAVSCCSAVIFGKFADGRQFANVLTVSQGHLNALRKDLTIGKESKGFPWAYYRCCWCSL